VPTTTLLPEIPTPIPPQIYDPEPTELSVPEEIVEVPTGTTTTTVEEPTLEEMPPEETTTTTELVPETYPDTTEETTTSTTAPDLVSNLDPNVPLTDDQVTSIIEQAESVEALVAILEQLAPEQVAQVVDQILADEPTQEQAIALATSPEVLAAVSGEQAAQIFEALDVAELSDAQTEQLIAAVQDAPAEVRSSFEDKIDIFKNALDTYVPLGSNIPVGTRRTLIAITAGITLAAAGTRIKR
jgi:xanthosine utilization system XapX-like protein